MKNLTVIVPLHEYNDVVEKLLSEAIESFKNADDGKSKLLFVGPSEVLNKIKETYKGKNITFLENENTEFQAQINAAVEKCGEYFSILEFDDKYSPKWFENAENYMQEYEDVSIYLPLTHAYLFDKEKIVGFINEAVWATSFSNNLGYFDIESLENYMNFNTTGGIFKTSDFISVGKLKESMKRTFWYEFLLRALFNGKKIYVVPKVGYIHSLNRKNSLSDIYTETISNEEADFWVECAKKEYMFKNDRNKKFEK